MISHGDITSTAPLSQSDQQKLLLASLIIQQFPLSINALYQLWPQYHPTKSKLTSPPPMITLNALTLCYQSGSGYWLVNSRLDQYLVLFTLLLHLFNQYGQMLLSLPALKIDPTHRQLLNLSGIANKKNLLQLLNYSANKLNRFLSPPQKSVLITMMQVFIHDPNAKNIAFSIQQKQWLGARQEYHLSCRLEPLWRRYYNYAFLACRFWALLLSLTDQPKVAPAESPTWPDPLIPLSHALAEKMALFNQDSSPWDTTLPSRIHPLLRQLIANIPFNLPLFQTDGLRLDRELTCVARHLLVPVENHYHLHFNYQQRCWFIEQLLLTHPQLKHYHRLPLTILTGYLPEQERRLERQLRSLLHYPLQITYLPIQRFNLANLDDKTILILSVYACHLPLYSPPIIQCVKQLTEHQKWCIIKIVLDALAGRIKPSQIKKDGLRRPTSLTLHYAFRHKQDNVDKV